MTGERCLRCGHEAGGCPHCDRVDDYLGAAIGGRPVCHLPDEIGMSCYHIETVYGGRDPHAEPSSPESVVRIARELEALMRSLGGG